VHDHVATDKNNGLIQLASTHPPAGTLPYYLSFPEINAIMQGFNMGRYVPPDLEGSMSFNQASGKGHALGARARKLKTEGVLIVRFECPFAIWCTHCKPEQIIGQGVRFNAEKKKVGNYYSTPIWSFRFKHTVCGEWIEVRTDPKNTEYVVVDGGRRRDTGEDKLLDGEIRIGTTEEEKARFEGEGGFGKLEKKNEDKQRLLDEKGRLEELAKRSERDWEDPYEQSKRLRKEFRVGRKERKEAAVKGEALKDKLSLGIELVEEKEEDGMRARLVEFGEPAEAMSGHKPMFEMAREEPQSMPAKDRGKRGKKLTPAELDAQNKARLAQKLSGNTRAAVDPFLSSEHVWQPSVRRKRVNLVAGSEPVPVRQSTALVDYDSD
jgi:coiled-coil domain-containing protein 130